MRMSSQRFEAIFVDECVLNYLAYRTHLGKAGYRLLDLRESETNPLGAGSSDEDIFAWATSRPDRPAIFTLNVKDFRKLNSLSAKKAIVLKAPAMICSSELLVEALNFIGTLPEGYYYSVAAAITAMKATPPS